MTRKQHLWVPNELFIYYAMRKHSDFSVEDKMAGSNCSFEFNSYTESPNPEIFRQPTLCSQHTSDHLHPEILTSRIKSTSLFGNLYHSQSIAHTLFYQLIFNPSGMDENVLLWQWSESAYKPQNPLNVLCYPSNSALSSKSKLPPEPPPHNSRERTLISNLP